MPRHPAWAHELFSDVDLDVIAAAVTEAEAETSAEIRVHLERRVPPGAPDTLARAREVFTALGMHAPAERNAVLIYLAVEDHRLAIVGDEGIHARVGVPYWEGLRDAMVERLRRRAPREAVLAAVADVGRVCRQFFPRRPDDRNELSDRVSLR